MLSIILPSYNEEENIERTAKCLSELLEQLPALDIIAKVLTW